MIILGSSSPRRVELLKTLTNDFKIIKPTFDEEKISKKENHYAIKESFNKALSIKDLINDEDFLITCDTVVILNKEIIGKPKDLLDAEKILEKLSNNKHKVVSGITIIYNNKIYKKEITTYVYFNKLSKEQILNYIKEENVLDKAGSYAIQDDEKFHLVKKIRGDYNNVVGFPLFYIKKMLSKFNLI